MYKKKLESHKICTLSGWVQADRVEIFECLQLCLVLKSSAAEVKHILL